MAEVTRFEAVGGIEAVELSWDIKAYGVIKYLLLEVGAEGAFSFTILNLTFDRRTGWFCQIQLYLFVSMFIPKLALLQQVRQSL